MTLTAASRFPAGPQASALDLRDLDGDRDVDVVVVDGFADKLRVLLNDGNGRLGAPRTLTPVIDHVTEVEALDVTGDGHADLVATHEAVDFSSGRISVLVGDGTGSFSAPVTTVVEPSVGRLAFGDFDDDGQRDAVARVGSGLGVLLGQGDGSFVVLPPILDPLFSPGGGESDIVPGRFDGDGHLDVVVSSEGAREVVLLSGDGLGGFREAGRHAVRRAGDIERRDLNGDRWLDLVVVNVNVGVVDDPGPPPYDATVLLNDGGNGFRILDGHVDAGTSSTGPQLVAMADLNGDGHAEAVFNDYADRLRVLRGTGGGRFTEPKRFGVRQGDPGLLALEDMDGDGRTDVVIGYSTANEGIVSVRLNPAP